MARAPGFEMNWALLNRDARTPTADVVLKPETKVRVRLVDSKGIPLSNVGLDVLRIAKMAKKLEDDLGQPDVVRSPGSDAPGMDEVWPEATTTDLDGWLTVQGLGTGIRVRLGGQDPRLGSQSLTVPIDPEGQKTPFIGTLLPVLHLSGRVTCLDTGEPLADTLIKVDSTPHLFIPSQPSKIRTDQNGRYQTNLPAGIFLNTTVYPSSGSPYLIFTRYLQIRKEKTDQILEEYTLDLKVPRGVLLTGQVIERGSGKPLEGAAVFHETGDGNVARREGTISSWMAAVTTSRNGRFQIAVPPGKGYLLFYGPTADFVAEMRGSRELREGKPGGKRNYAHAFVPYDVKQGEGPVKIDVGLTRGTTLTGRVVGPDGQTVQEAEIITTLSISPFHTLWRGDFTLPVREGRFTLHGLPSNQAVKCSFLDARNGWGTTVELSAAMAKDPNVTIKLEPCGTAKVRLVDQQGQPMEKFPVSLNFVATPGPGSLPSELSETEAEKTKLLADEEIYVNIDRLHYWNNSPISDTTGRVTLPDLIPGATYRIYTNSRDPRTQGYETHDFQVKAGEMLDLGDLVTRPLEDRGGGRN